MLFGRKIMGGSGGMGRAASAMRGFGRTSREKEDVARAEEGADVLRQRRADLAAEVEAEVARVRDDADPSRIALKEVRIAPKKTDITVGTVVLAWAPWRVAPDGRSEPAYSV
jgi:hypothetical protein